MSTSSLPSLDTPAAAAPTRNASATGPSAQKVLLRSGSGPGRPARLVRAGPVVVVIDDAGLTRPDQAVLGQHLTGHRRDHAHSWSRWW